MNPGLQPSHAPAQLSPRLLSEVRAYTYRLAGIELPESKREMVAARLWKRTRALGYPSVEAYFAAVQRDAGGELECDFLDAITTNHTSFFREPAHFDFLRERILPDLRRRSDFTIWSAACSSGEEAYSIAVTLLEESGGSAVRGQVLATDLSTRVLETARQGIYPEDRFRQMDAAWRSRYLLRGRGEQSGKYRFRPEVRERIRFARLNLMEPLPVMGPFPLIFLRNVMIYFDRPTQERLVGAISQLLEPGGYLFVGHSESLNGIQHDLEHVQVAVYRRRARGTKRS
jgi:chemotaxis protein methyltransferase CheR